MGILKHGRGIYKGMFSGMRFGGKGVVATAESEEADPANNLVTCTWAEGNDIFNTAAPAGHVWTGAGLNLPNAVFTRDSSGNGWNSETYSAKITGTLAATQYYVNMTSLNLAQVAIRFYVKVTDFNVINNGGIPVVKFVTSGADIVMELRVMRVDPVYNLNFRWMDVSSVVDQDNYAFSIGTGYQIEMLFKQNDDGPYDYGKVWDAAGTSLLATMATNNTTKNSAVDEVRFGYLAGAGTTANTIYLDAVSLAGAAAGQTLLGPKT